MGATGRVADRQPIAFESQLLAIGSGFGVLCVIAALFIVVQKQRRRRESNASRDFHSPLIGTLGKPNKFRATSGSFGSGSSGSPVLTPGGSDSSNSPQCTPLTPYSSFSAAVGHQTSSGLLPTANVVPQVQSDDRGSISITLNYDRNSSTLQVSVLACHNLLDYNSTGPNDQCHLNPYVKLRLSDHRAKTRVVRKTRHPFYDEQFEICGIHYDQLHGMSLHLAVLNFDRFSRDTVIGEAFVNLAAELNRRDVNENKQTIELPLFPRPTYDVRAQVLLSMSHNPQTNSVNVAVLKVKDLPSDDRIGLIDPYVKVYLLLNGQRVAKHKTHVKKHTMEPVFNESFAFDLPMTLGGTRLCSSAEILNAVSFEVQLLNHGGVTRQELIGQCIIGHESRHWQAILQNPLQQEAEWHRFIPL